MLLPKSLLYQSALLQYTEVTNTPQPFSVLGQQDFNIYSYYMSSTVTEVSSGSVLCVFFILEPTPDLRNIILVTENKDQLPKGS